MLIVARVPETLSLFFSQGMSLILKPRSVRLFAFASS
jgi:hypothetical protein